MTTKSPLIILDSISKSKLISHRSLRLSCGEVLPMNWFEILDDINTQLIKIKEGNYNIKYLI